MEHKKTEIAVIGGGPGGLAAAVTAARSGAKVLLIDRNGYLGGQLGSGLPFLGFLDRKKRQVIGGIAQEFVERLEKVDGTKGHAYCPFHLSTTMVHPFYSRIIAFQMIKEAGVEILLHCELTDVKTDAGKIQSITVAGKGVHVQIEADIFIDATGDGDVGYLAGTQYGKGQEDTHVLQPPTLMFNMAGVDFDAFCDFLEDHPEELPYGLGMENLREGYDAEFFRNNPSFTFFGMNHLIQKLRAQGKCPIQRDTIIFMRQAIEGEIAVNTTRILNFDGSDIHDLSRGEMEAHLQIPELIQMFREYVPGFEKCYLTSVNAVIGVRESRRLVGQKTLCYQECLAGAVPEDTIALCSYFLDIHNGNGDDTKGISIQEPFGIPYLCLVSKDIDNLMMAGRDISVDPVAFGATRIMNVCMAVGQAAGEAAAMAVAENTAPKDISVPELRERLRQQKAILEV